MRRKGLALFQNWLHEFPCHASRQMPGSSHVPCILPNSSWHYLQVPNYDIVAYTMCQGHIHDVPRSHRSSCLRRRSCNDIRNPNVAAPNYDIVVTSAKTRYRETRYRSATTISGVPTIQMFAMHWGTDLVFKHHSIHFQHTQYHFPHSKFTKHCC